MFMFTVCVLALAIAFQTSPPPIGEQQQQSTAQEGAESTETQPSTPAAQLGTTDEQNGASGQAKWWPPPPLWDIYWPTIGVVILGLVGAWVALCTLDKIKEQTVAARTAADAADVSAKAIINSERGYVVVDVRPQTLHFNQTPLIVQCIVWNCGKTPAKMTFRISDIGFTPTQADGSPELPQTPNYQANIIDNAGTTLAEILTPASASPHGLGSSSIILRLDIGTEESAAWTTGLLVPYFCGRVIYVDSFERSYETTFGFWYDMHYPFGRQWRRIEVQAYNEST